MAGLPRLGAGRAARARGGYWDKPSGDRAYLPLGGGLQYAFGARRQEMAVSLQFFKYVLRPSKGAEYDLRLMVEFDF